MSVRTKEAAEPETLPPSEATAILDNWVNLNAAILDMPLWKIKRLMEVELSDRKRDTVLLRLHGRFNRVRAVEERAALLGGRLPW